VSWLHSQGMYVIGRIVVFEDPLLAKARPDLAIYDTSKTSDPKNPVPWENNGGLAWMDPASTQVWDYNLQIAHDALARGFDEINVDYVRFPTDGAADTMGYPFWNQKIPRSTVIANFFKALRQGLPDAKISADVFGQTTVSANDMGIGQVIENTFANLDYVCPMVYPSHYANGFLGFANPADHPYQIIENAQTTALEREQAYAVKNPGIKLAQIRPWLQDFNLGAIYTKEMVQQEIQALSDADRTTSASDAGYLLWNPSNLYTSGAIAK